MVHGVVAHFMTPGEHRLDFLHGQESRRPGLKPLEAEALDEPVVPRLNGYGVQKETAGGTELLQDPGKGHVACQPVV